MSTSTYDKVRKVVIEQLGIVTPPFDLTGASRFVADLGADSLDTVELTMALEDAFELEHVADEDWEAVITVQDAVAVIDKYLLAAPKKPDRTALQEHPPIDLLALSDEIRGALIGRLARSETRVLMGADTVRAVLVDGTLYVSIDGANVLTVTGREMRLEVTDVNRPRAA